MSVVFEQWLIIDRPNNEKEAKSNINNNEKSENAEGVEFTYLRLEAGLRLDLPREKKKTERKGEEK